jgi:hypothetical protein
MIGSIACRRLSNLRSSSLSLLSLPRCLISIWGGVLVHAPVTQVSKNHLGLDTQALQQNGALLNLLVHGVPVKRVTWKAPGSHDQIALECHGQTDLHPKLVRVTAFALADALDFWRIPAVELCAVAHRFAAAGLCEQAFGLVQCLAQGFLQGLAERGHLASHLALQASNDGPLAFDDFAHAFCACVLIGGHELSAQPCSPAVGLLWRRLV